MPNEPDGADARSSRPAPRPAVVGRAPDEASLREAAVSHLARYGTTKANLARVLQRRIDRWVRAATGEWDADEIREVAARARTAIAGIVETLAAEGAVDDAAFAEIRARRLRRAGRSQRAISAHLAARGVKANDVDPALSAHGDDAEFAAAVATLRRRRAGPFRSGGADDDTRRRELAALARAGFAHDVARRALALDHDAAALIVERLKRG